MRITRAFTALALVGVAGFMVATMGTAQADNNAAVITRDFGCGMFDGDGGFVVTEGSLSVVTSSEHTTLICKARGVANSTGSAVHYRDFLCGTFLGATDDSQETVSASGNATLRCRI